MKTLIGLVVLFAIIPALRTRELHKQEGRARLAADYLHRHLDQTTDDFRAVIVEHRQDAVCLVYQDAGADLGHAILPDGSMEITWNVDEDSAEWGRYCAVGRSDRDLISFVRTEDRF